MSEAMRPAGHVCLLAVLVASCAPPVAEGPAFAAFTVGPSDLATSVVSNGNPAIMVTNDTVASVFEATDAPIFAGAISVMTWPERAPVSGAVRTTAPPANGDYRYRFEFVPTSPLTDRWYAVRVDLSQVGARYSTAAPLEDPARAEGEILSRFFEGSLPLARASVGLDAGGRMLLVVGASESIHAAGNPVDLVVVTTTEPLSCRAADGSDPVRELVDRSSMELNCGVVDLDQVLHVHILPGFASATGVPLRDVSGAEDITMAWNPQRDGSVAPRHASDALFALP